VIQGGIPAQARHHDHLILHAAQASDTAAKPPSTTNTSWRPGSQRRTCFIICRTQAMLVLCRRLPRVFSGQQSAVRNGNAHTRRLQGTGTNSIIATHFRPKHRMTWLFEERTASR
jgi:hypothetical protein